MRKGFTLVELSIVLVIIGLLIGGVLVGQSLIESAKITKLGKEFQELEIQFHLFKQRFKYLPGEMPNAWNKIPYTPRNGNPDGNGLYDDHSFFDQFVQINLIFGTKYATCQPTSNDFSFRASCGSVAADSGIVGGLNAPASKAFKNAAFMAIAGGQNCTYNPDTSNSCNYAGLNYIYLQSKEGPSLKPKEMMPLDAKFDDGKSMTGNIVTHSWSDGCTLNNPWWAGNYAINTDTVTCTAKWLLQKDAPR